MSENKPEDNWFELGGEPVDDDYIDPELLKLARRPAVIELLLFLVIMGFGAFLSMRLQDDLGYYFADAEPVEIGAVDSLAQRLEEEPDYLAALGSNIYVSLEGIPTRRAETPDRNYQYAQLAGAPIFIQQPHERAGEDPMLRDTRRRYGPYDDPSATRYYVAGSGRFRSFDALGRKHSGLLGYYADHYNMWFCGFELTHEQLQFQRVLTEQTRESLAEELGYDPTEEQIEDAVAEAFSCQNGYFFELEKAPSDYQYVLIIYVVIGLVELGCLFFLIRWIRRFIETR